MGSIPSDCTNTKKVGERSDQKDRMGEEKKTEKVIVLILYRRDTREYLQRSGRMIPLRFKSSSTFN